MRILQYSAWAAIAIVFGLACLNGGAASMFPQEKQPPSTARPPREATEDALPNGAIARFGTLRFNHGDAVNSAAFSPDGKTLATVSRGRPAGVRVWNVADGREMRQIAKGALDLTFLSDNETLAMAVGDGILLVDAKTGLDKKKIPSKGSTEAVAVSPDGKVLATWGVEHNERQGGPLGGTNIIGLYDLASGKQFYRLARKDDVQAMGGATRGSSVSVGDLMKKIEFGSIPFLAFTADGKGVVAAEWDETAAFWDVVSGKLLRVFGSVKHLASTCTLSGDSKTLATASTDGTLRGYEVSSGKLAWEISLGQQKVWSMAFAPGDKFLSVASAMYEGNQWIHTNTMLEIATGKRVFQFPTFGNYATFSPDGRTLMVAEGGGRIRLFDVATGRELRPPVGHRGRVEGLAFSPDGKTLLSESSDGTMRWWDLKTGKEIRQCEVFCNSLRSNLVYSPDGLQFAYRTDNRTIVLRDSASGKELRTLEGHPGFIYVIAFSSDGKTLVSAERNGPTLVWDLETGKNIRTIPAAFATGGETVAFSTDGTLRAVVKNNHAGLYPGPHEFGIWEMDTGKEVGMFNMTTKRPPATLLFTPDNKSLIAGTYDGTVCIVDVKTGKEVLRFKGHDSAIYHMTLSPDTSLLATEGKFAGKPSIGLWDAKSGKQICRFPERSDAVHSLAFSGDGTVLASGGADGTIMLWEVPKGRW
jgi:WD40 repeat protein